MPTSAKTKSQPGTNGLEDSNLPSSENSLLPEQPENKSLEQHQQKDVKAVEESDGSSEKKSRPGFRTSSPILTPDDKKIQRLMNRAIAERIGFDPNSPSRSIRV